MNLLRPVSATCFFLRSAPVHPQLRQCCTSASLSEADFEKRAEDTLHALTDFFDTLPESHKTSKDYDVSYSMGVLTVQLEPSVGTYVINKQTPNRQIWLSSPISGPKRYDWLDRKWIYKRDNVSLHELLEQEFSDIFKTPSLGIRSLQ